MTKDPAGIRTKRMPSLLVKISWAELVFAKKKIRTSQINALENNRENNWLINGACMVCFDIIESSWFKSVSCKRLYHTINPVFNIKYLYKLWMAQLLWVVLSCPDDMKRKGMKFNHRSSKDETKEQASI